MLKESACNRRSQKQHVAGQECLQFTRVGQHGQARGAVADVAFLDLTDATAQRREGEMSAWCDRAVKVQSFAKSGQRAAAYCQAKTYVER